MVKLERNPDLARSDQDMRWERPRPVLVDEDRIAPVLIRPSRRWRALTLLAGLAGGAVLIAFGTIALNRGDTEGSWNNPIVDVNGWPHSPLLGLLEIAAGAAMVIVSLWSVAEFFVGAIVAGFGVFALAEPEVLDETLSIDAANAWLFVAVGAVALLSASLAYFGRRTAVVPASETYGAPTI